MVEQILIRLDEGASAADWWVLDSEGHRRGGIGHAPLAEIAPHALSRRTTVAVPSHRVTLTRVRLPVRSRRQWAVAIPFALEEQVAGDLDSLHFAYGQADSDGNIPVAVVERACLEKWLAALFEAGLHPDELWPEVFLIPETPRVLTIARSNGHLLLRGSGFQGCAVPEALLPEILKRVHNELPEEARPREVRFSGDPEDPIVPVLEDLVTRLDCAWAVSRDLWYEAGTRRRIQGLNLLQGAYAPGHQQRARWARWKPVAQLGGAVLAVAFALLVVQRIRLEATAQTWKARVHRIFHHLLPGQPYVSPRAQIEQAIRARARGATGTIRFLDFLARMSESRPPTIHLLSVAYSTHTIDLHFLAPSLAQASAFEQSAIHQRHWLRRHQKVVKEHGGWGIRVSYRRRNPSP